MLFRFFSFLLAAALGLSFAQTAQPLGERAHEYLTALIRLNTTDPPGNETRVADYLKSVTARYDIPSELLGPDPTRLNFVARLRGTGQAPPLLLMAHEDVVPADRAQWSVDPFAAEERDGAIYGRGAEDDKNLLAAELAVLIELKLRGVKLRRDVILLSEADEEAGSSGIQWLIQNAWDKIRAEAALNEGGMAQDLASGTRLFQIQTAEKIPTRVVLTAHGTAGHASMPRPDNPVVHLAVAIVKLGAEQPVRLNETTRRNFRAISTLPEYAWLARLLPMLEDPAHEAEAAAEIRNHDREIDAQLHTTISPTMLQAGTKINVIPNVAEAQVDVRRLPNETREEVVARLRRLVNDPAVEVTSAGDQEMPATPPSPLDNALYRTMERVLEASAAPRRALVVPYMSRGATDGAFLRQKGMAVYGAPVFLREGGVSRAHGNDERISVSGLESGTELLYRIVLAAVE
jgi:acetylornithine deacetylase/succinyl-diaminopimelate desuccinylase-like protein